MKISFIAHGKTADKRLDSLTQDYCGRISHYLPFEFLALPNLRNTKSLTRERQRQQEGEQLGRQLLAGDHLVLLDERGKLMRSTEFAQWLERKMSTLQGRLVFVAGGPYGFSAETYSKASEELSLSLMTFSHQMVRLFFVEQLYRALAILNGEPYHHE
ncbi:MAG: 23S rRNA (pseudouridine(1915)-N(3))-methyltransferase RlmH [Prevotellaceae bacterium]|nr:23S rRNA (pseudouridine(1915)-N(3))-methyltransferase RlmH [Prevotellaceae bacterium]